MEQNIKIELCGGKMPVKSHDTDAAFDVFSREDVFIEPYMRCAVPLGFKIQLPKHLAAIIQPRSGMSLKGMACKAKTQNGDIDLRIDADVLIGLILQKEWKRKNFSDFKYLSVELSDKEYWAIIIIMFLLNIGLSVWVVTNNYEN